MSQCFNCGSKFTLDPNSIIGRRDECDSCGQDIRCCRNCQFYDRNSYNECRESSASRVVEKDKSNFCDFFQLAKDGNEIEQEKESALSAAEALFKK